MVSLLDIEARLEGFGSWLRTRLARDSSVRRHFPQERSHPTPQPETMGRRTYEALAAVASDVRDEGYQGMTRLTTTVFSRTLQGVDWRVLDGRILLAEYAPTGRPIPS